MYLEVTLSIEYNVLENDIKMTFFQENSILSILSAREHGYDDVKNKFFDHSGVGFNFEALSLDEN